MSVHCNESSAATAQSIRRDDVDYAEEIERKCLAEYNTVSHF